MVSQERINQEAGERIRRRADQREERAVEFANFCAGEQFDWTKIDEPARLAERARRLGLHDAASLLLRGTPDAEAGKRIFEQIINANNLLGVTFLFEGARMARAVGRITLPVQGGRRLGTGFMISSRIMMTNNHVLSDSIGL